jgi:3',5'-cyclic AMP phosphodiesterase CpdA
MANENDNIDFVVVGGDLTTGQYSSPESCLDAASAGISPLKKCTKPVLILAGNHDDNSYGTDTRASNDESFVFSRIVSDKYWNDRILDVYTPDAVHDTNHQDSKYYYYDIESKNTRVICLDAADKEAEYDKNGVVTGLKLLDSTKPYICTRYRTGYSFWGYSEKQLKWLATEALTAEDGWNYIFV